MLRRKAFSFMILLCLSVFIISAEPISATQCQLSVEGGDTSTKFQRLANEKGVRMVYLNLKLSNGSYRPLHSKNKILPYRWSWTRSNREPFLGLSYDCDVLSLGLLSNQVKSLDVNLREVQSGCLGHLNASYQEMAIARALMGITHLNTNKPPNGRTDVVCRRILLEHAFGYGSGFKYQCCGEYTLNHKSMINCNLRVKESEWLKAFNVILAILVPIVCLYWPLVFCVLPSYFFVAANPTEHKVNSFPPGKALIQVQMEIKNQTEHEQLTRTEENGDYGRTSQKKMTENIPVDDLSPITFKTLFQKLEEKVPSMTYGSSIKFFIFWFGFVPIFFYIKLVLFFIIKNHYFDDTSRKLIFQVGDFYLFVFSMNRPLVYVMFVIPLIIIPGTMVWFWKPIRKENSPKETISWFKNLKQEIIRNMRKMPRRIFKWTKFCFSCTLKCQVFKNSSEMPSTRCRKAISVLCSVASLLVIVPILAVLVTLMFTITSTASLIIFSPYVTFMRIGWWYISKRTNNANDLMTLSNLIISAIIIYLSISLGVIVTFSGQFLVRMLGFIIIGITLNAEATVAYVTFAFIVSKNMYLCFRSLQNRYKEVKDMLAEMWKERMKEDDTVPEDLFWRVCNDSKYDVLPIANEICLMLSKILAILIFLWIALTAIFLFKLTYNFSTIVSTIAVFISGKISELFFTGVTTTRSFSGWQKIRMKKVIQSAVKDYIVNATIDRNNSSDSSSVV